MDGARMGHVGDKANEDDSLGLFGEGALLFTLGRIAPTLKYTGALWPDPFTLATAGGFDLHQPLSAGVL